MRSFFFLASCVAYRTCCVDTATAVLHAVVDRFLVNIQTDVVHSLRNNSWGAHTRFFSIRPFSASSSGLVMPCRAIAVARYKAGTCLILLPRSTLRRSFSTSGSAPTCKNTLYASEIDSVFSIRPCLTRMRRYEGTANACVGGTRLLGFGCFIALC